MDYHLNVSGWTCVFGIVASTLCARQWTGVKRTISRVKIVIRKDRYYFAGSISAVSWDRYCVHH
eukprot:2482884-Amphidinium_carterae.1